MENNYLINQELRIERISQERRWLGKDATLIMSWIASMYEGFCFYVTYGYSKYFSCKGLNSTKELTVFFVVTKKSWNIEKRLKQQWGCWFFLYTNIALSIVGWLEWARGIFFSPFFGVGQKFGIRTWSIKKKSWKFRPPYINGGANKVYCFSLATIPLWPSQHGWVFVALQPTYLVWPVLFLVGKL